LKVARGSETFTDGDIDSAIDDSVCNHWSTYRRPTADPVLGMKRCTNSKKERGDVLMVLKMFGALK
jgi:hypothetical protein